jgi:hypothetical protein
MEKIDVTKTVIVYGLGWALIALTAVGGAL